MIQHKLKEAFETGFSRASKSLGQLTQEKTFYNYFHHGYWTLNSTLDNVVYQRHNGEKRYLLTTNIFGDVKGKSYFFLTSDEYHLLTHRIPDAKDAAINFKHEFLKELNNIISAAVITELSNELSKKMYGNIPVMVGEVNSKLEETLVHDFISETKEIHLNSIFFSFENHPDINPLFVWVINAGE